MKVILDECLPKRLIYELPGLQAVTVQMAGWAGVKNGELLKRIGTKFDVFITIDGNLANQQNTRTLPFGVIVLNAKSNKIEDIRPLIPIIVQALQLLKPGQVCRVP